MTAKTDKRANLWNALQELASIPAELLRGQQEAAARDDEILRLLRSIKAHALGDARRDKAMSKALDTLTKEVGEQGDAVESAVTLIAGLAEQIRAAGGDEEKLEKLAADLEASQQKLAEAVTANTPHDPSANA